MNGSDRKLRSDRKSGKQPNVSRSNGSKKKQKSGKQPNVTKSNEAKKKRPRIKHRKCHGPNKGHFNVTKQLKICGALRQFVRKDTASRGEIVKAVWDYVKKKQLQCKGRGRIFMTDARLATVLGPEGMEQDGFKIMTHIERHILCAA